MKPTQTLFALALFLAPFAVGAADVYKNPMSIFIGNIIVFFNAILVPFIFAVAFIVFLWGIFNYFILGGANEEKQKEGAKFALWGIVGFAVMISLWGLVNLLVQTFGFGGMGRPDLPTFGPTQTSGQNAEKFAPSNSGGASGPTYDSRGYQYCSEANRSCPFGTMCDLTVDDGRTPMCLPLIQ